MIKPRPALFKWRHFEPENHCLGGALVSAVLPFVSGRRGIAHGTRSPRMTTPGNLPQGRSINRSCGPPGRLLQAGVTIGYPPSFDSGSGRMKLWSVTAGCRNYPGRARSFQMREQPLGCLRRLTRSNRQACRHFARCAVERLKLASKIAFWNQAIPPVDQIL